MDSIQERLRHVYWIGGGSGAGKSTIAKRVAGAHAFTVYDSDEAMHRHAARLAPEAAPLLAQFLGMDMDERWVRRPPATMLDTFPWFRGEGFGLVVEDLLALPTDRPVVAEGFRLLPSRVDPLLATRAHAVWLIPTAEFRVAAFEQRRPRGMPWSFVDKTSDPIKALRNLLERDGMFTERLADDARELNLTMIEVTTDMTEDVVTQLVSATFGLPGA